MGQCKDCVHWNFEGMGADGNFDLKACKEVARAGIHASLDQIRMTDEERIFIKKAVREEDSREREILGQMKMRFSTTAEFGCVRFEAKPCDLINFAAANKGKTIKVEGNTITAG